MCRPWKRTAFAAVLAAALSAAALGAHPAPASAVGAEGAGEVSAWRGLRVARLIGTATLPHKMEFDGTVVGGFSGMDRDPATGTWYFLSDDRDRYNPARFYTGDVDIDPMRGTFGGVTLTDVSTLRDGAGATYPGFGQPYSVDPESLRYDPVSGRVLWAQEGDRPDAQRPALPLAQQSIRWATTDGEYAGDVPLPRNLELTDHDAGTRRNLGLEGLALSPRHIAAVNEDPRFEDGPAPTVDAGAATRITVWDRQERVRAQYAYPLEAVPAAPVPADGITDGGVSELLAVDDHRYLALERFWIEGVGYKSRLYEIDLRGATNVLGRESLASGDAYRPVSKRLVYDFGSLPGPQQNLEAMSWGPRLLTGECTLVVASDDNFAADEEALFLAFAVRDC